VLPTNERNDPWHVHPANGLMTLACDPCNKRADPGVIPIIELDDPYVLPTYERGDPGVLTTNGRTYPDV
jgi:hypothetical protein